MRVLFIGSVLFSEKALNKIILMGEEIVGVVCRESSIFNADFSDLGVIAKKNNIAYYYTNDINTKEAERWIKEKKPEVIYCFGWSQIINQNILLIPKLGIIGFHPAALPNNKGRHPIIWALFLGLKETASTFFFMDEGTDTGDILSQEKISISLTDDAATLYEKVSNIALQQIEDFTKKLKGKYFRRISQNSSIGNSWRKRNIEDGKIDWRMNSIAIYNLVRALTKPYLGAHFKIGGKNYKVWKVEIVEQYGLGKNIEPGNVLKINKEDNSFDVKTYDGIVRVLKHDVDNLDILGEYL